MTDGVFHPGHDEWHGQTVVVYTTGPRTIIGRWHAVEGDQLSMRDVAVHQQDSADEESEAWVTRLKRYGIPVEHTTFALPHGEVDRVVRLRDA